MKRYWKYIVRTNQNQVLDKHSQKYDKFFIPGDFNAENSELCLSELHYEHSADILLKKKHVPKALINPNFITDSPLSLQNTVQISSWLSDFHEMVVKIMKMKFKKTSPKEIFYQDFLQSFYPRTV